MIAILLNASLVTDGQGYVRRVQLEFAGKGRSVRHPSDSVGLTPGMTRVEVAAALRTAADRIEHFHQLDEERAVQS